MACNQLEDLILEYCEGAISPDDRKRVESHLAGCGPCRTFLAAQKELDLRLARAITPPQLSIHFKRRVFAEIESEPDRMRLGDFLEVLDWIGYSGLALAAIYLLGQSPDPALYTFWVALAGGVGFGLWEGRDILRDFSL
ncbi:MAG: anti-sigma factor family protein [Candidatus Acidiferrales bacterium]